MQTGGGLSPDGIAVQLQRATMEARSFQPDAIGAAKSIVAAQESLLGRITPPRKGLTIWLLTTKGMIALVERNARSANRISKKHPTRPPLCQTSMKSHDST